MAQCELCGREFALSKNTGNWQRFCSRECRSLNEKARRKAEYLDEAAICKECGQPFRVHHKRDKREFCSRRCSAIYHIRLTPCQVESKKREQERRNQGIVGPFCTIWHNTCQICGCQFIYKRPASLCASEACQLMRKREWYIHHAERKKGKNICICKECGQKFEAPYGDKRRSFCSLECGRRFGHRIRDARKRTNIVESISPLAVYNRDGWRCGICGKRVNKQLRYPHPMSASVDHIIPLVHGGTHTFGNVQCTHLLCNMKKGARGSFQLMFDLT